MCAMESCLRLERFQPKARLEPGTARSVATRLSRLLYPIRRAGDMGIYQGQFPDEFVSFFIPKKRHNFATLEGHKIYSGGELAKINTIFTS